MKFHTHKKKPKSQKIFNSIQFKKKKRNETKQTKNTNMTKLKTFWKVTSIVSIVIGLLNSIVLMSIESKIIQTSHQVECQPCSNVNDDDDDDEREIQNIEGFGVEVIETPKKGDEGTIYIGRTRDETMAIFPQFEDEVSAIVKPFGWNVKSIGIEELNTNEEICGKKNEGEESKLVMIVTSTFIQKTMDKNRCDSVSKIIPMKSTSIPISVVILKRGGDSTTIMISRDLMEKVNGMIVQIGIISTSSSSSDQKQHQRIGTNGMMRLKKFISNITHSITIKSKGS